MRIQAVYNFYLDFMLPRVDNKHGIGIQTKIDHCDAWISTRGEDEALFPSETDETLSSTVLQLKPIVRPEVSISWEAGSRILDRISVILEWDSVTSPLENDFNTDKYLEKAFFGANALLDHIRVSSGLFDIKKISRSWDPAKSQIEITAPYTQSWFDVPSNEGIGIFDGLNSMGSAQGIRIGPVPVISMAILSRTLTGQGPPPLHLSLLLDAAEALSTVSLREAILFIASACETRARTLADTQSVVSKTRIKAITTDKNSSFATKFYECLPREVHNRSLQIENPESFTQIDESYFERNSLIHTGRVSADFGRNSEPVQLRRATEWLESALLR